MVPCTGTFVVSTVAVTSMTLQQPKHSDFAELPQQLPTLFVQLLAEMAFADAWVLGSPEEVGVARGAATVCCCVPFHGLRSGVVLVAADPALLTDLAAGYHSLPDEMVDDGTRLEFLAEAGALLVREISGLCSIPSQLVPGAPRLPLVGEIPSLWSDHHCLKAGFGCNGDGWMVVAVRFDV